MDIFVSVGERNPGAGRVGAVEATFFPHAKQLRRWRCAGPPERPLQDKTVRSRTVEEAAPSAKPFDLACGEYSRSRGTRGARALTVAASPRAN
jgi:hypothetical protein